VRTIVYIDGYNFYFGLLKNTAHKWLDVVALVKHICHIQNPEFDIVGVKFFTAPVITRVSSRGDKAQHAQQTYHRALNARYPDILDIINGYYILEQGNFPEYKHPIVKGDKVAVWRLEEKQTDVNIALHLYRDVTLQTCEHIVLVSGDSDLEPALTFIKQDYPQIHRGLILPRPKPVESAKGIRSSNKTLSDLSHWTRSYVLDTELRNFQFPDKVPTQKKPALKPDYW
jgi:uncharacterized LabA/DUF88 family protein